MIRLVKLTTGILGLSISLVGCGHFPSKGPSERSSSGVDVASQGETPLSTHTTELNGDKFETNYTSRYGKIELEMNHQVKKYIKYYSGRGRRHMARYLARSTRYVGLMKQILREEGLPEELIYVVFIESGFSSSAHSRANAVGYWQFIRETGRRYGLTINGYVDERRDPVLSTRAAARFFKALYNLFGDWHLAMAAYNTGENRVKRAVMRYGTRDFWKLARRRRLLRETRQYVPRILAAMAIAQDPQRYGFEDIDYQPAIQFDSVPVTQPVSLKKLALHGDLSLSELKKINPQYRTHYVPTYKEGLSLRVPKGFSAVALAALSKSSSSAPKIVSNGYRFYRVRRGDTLSEIARRFRTRISTIQRMNHLRRRSLIRVGQRLKVPERYGSKVVSRHARQKVARNARTISSSSSGDIHVVQRGENLSVIARRYGMSVAQIRKMNQLGRRSLLRVGQRLRVEADPNDRYYVIRRGDTLITIARKYRVPLAKLAAVNSLRNRSRIMVGDKLVIPD